MFVVLVAALAGLVTSVVVMYKLLSSDKKRTLI